MGGNPQLPASSWEAKHLDSTSSAPTLDSHQKDRPPRHLALDAMGADIRKTYQARANKQEVTNEYKHCAVAVTPGLSTEGTGRNTHLPGFPWKDPICIL